MALFVVGRPGLPAQRAVEVPGEERRGQPQDRVGPAQLADFTLHLRQRRSGRRTRAGPLPIGPRIVVAAAVSGFTAGIWNDPEDQLAVPGVGDRHQRQELDMTDRIRDIMRHLDRWTLTVFNPYIASDHRR